jgi:hypothetical protein
MLNKSELIDAITRLNRSARPEFLAEFSTQVLADYLARLAPVEGIADLCMDVRSESLALTGTVTAAS